MLFIVLSRLALFAGNASSLRQREGCGYRGTPGLDPGREKEKVRVSHPQPSGSCLGACAVDDPSRPGGPASHALVQELICLCVAPGAKWWPWTSARPWADGT